MFRVTNASGVVNHECDCLILSKAGYLTEIEIKRSYADFMADFKKDHSHDDGRINEFYFMVHESFYGKVLEKLIELKRVPSGIYTYDDECRIRLAISRDGVYEKLSEYYSVDWYRLDNVFYYLDGGCARKLFLEERFQLARLGAMRYKNMMKRLLDK